MTDGLEITFHGAAGTVTGSCMELVSAGRHILIDCGLFQGSRSLERLNFEPFRFNPARIDAVVLTHAHIDHCGLLPRLAAKGFSGAIWSTAATRDLAAFLLADSAHLQENDAEHRNRRRDRSDEPPFEPLYHPEDVELAMTLFRTVELDEWFEPAPGFRARLWNAGHILGSASVEVQAGGVSTLFSGDIGPARKSLEPPPEGPIGIDHVVCESTYGDRDRDDVTLAERRAALQKAVSEALGRGGNLIIPVFAVERTQELLLDLATLIDREAIPARPIFIDSPLATRVTSVFAHEHLAETENGAIFRHPSFHFVESSAESMRLNSLSGAIILAGSGMCEGGRVRHHLVHNLARPDSTVLFVGYQAQGSLGRSIVDGAQRVRISGHDIAVRAQISRIETYSAHADRADILGWIRRRHPIAGSLFLDHGEKPALESLRGALDADESVLVPALGERYRLLPSQPARRLSTGNPEAQAVVGADWQNDYAQFAVNLKHELQRIPSEEARRAALRQMRRVLDDYAAFREHRSTSSDHHQHHKTGHHRARG
jgi:metallo-beta-lactamase family protein